MEQSRSSEANRFSSGQEIPRILLKPKIHYRIHERPSSVPILRQIDPVHASLSHFLKIRFNIILPSKPASSMWSRCHKCPPPHQNPVCSSSVSCTCYLPHPSHFYWCVHLNNILIFSEEYRACSSSDLKWEAYRAGHVARMSEERGVYRVLLGKPEGRWPLGRPRRRWVNNIRMDLEVLGWWVYGLNWAGPG